MLVLASDHAGFKLKEKLKTYFRKKGLDFLDLGTNSPQSIDYPPIAARAAKTVLQKKGSRGILLCGSGQGMAIVANRFKEIRAAVCWNVDSAKETREDNDTNILSLPARFISGSQAIAIVEAWLKTPFSRALRHQKRIDQIDQQN